MTKSDNTENTDIIGNMNDESTELESSIETEEPLALGGEEETQPGDSIESPSLDETDTDNSEISEVIEGDEILALGDESETQPADPVETGYDIEESPSENGILDVVEDTQTAISETVEEVASTVNSFVEEAVSTATSTVPQITYQAPTNTGKNMTNMPNIPSSSSVSSNYDEYKILPDASWPPPMFMRKNVTPKERYYMEHRWNSQWRFFDKKATENKERYFLLQRIVVIGSVTVPVLVSLDPDIVADIFNLIPYVTILPPLARTFIDFATVVLSLSVAIAAGLESLNKYGDNWGSYRQAAEELQAEKSYYDVQAGRYANNPDSFSRFVERCEEVIAQQHGRFIASVEKQVTESEKRGEEFMGGDDDDGYVVEPTYTESTETSMG